MRVPARLVSFLAGLFLFPAAAWAAEVSGLASGDPAALAPPSMGSLLLRAVLSLALLGGLAFLTVRFLQRRAFVARPGAWIRVLDQVAVGPNKGLVLVEIAGKVYVLGVSEHNITRLLEIRDPELLRAILAEEGVKAPLFSRRRAIFRRESFSGLLRRELSGSEEGRP